MERCLFVVWNDSGRRFGWFDTGVSGEIQVVRIVIGLFQVGRARPSSYCVCVCDKFKGPRQCLPGFTGCRFLFFFRR